MEPSKEATTSDYSRIAALQGHFDLEKVRSFGGFEGQEAIELFCEILDTFLEDASARLQRLPRLLETSDVDALAHEAHSLKGSSRNVCALRLGDQFESLEELIAAELDLEDTRRQLEEINAEFNSISQAFTSYQAGA